MQTLHLQKTFSLFFRSLSWNPTQITTMAKSKVRKVPTFIHAAMDMWFTICMAHFKLRLILNENNHHQHHHHVALSARVSLTLSHHQSLSSIAPERSSRLHAVSTQSCCILVLAGRPASARPCEEVHRNISLMSSSLLLQQCLACLVRLTWIVFVMSDRWPYSCCFVGCCLQDLFNIACSILVLLP